MTTARAFNTPRLDHALLLFLHNHLSMSASTSALTASTRLRRRMHFLSRSHAKDATRASPSTGTGVKDKRGKDEGEDSSESEYESASDESDEAATRNRRLRVTDDEEEEYASDDPELAPNCRQSLPKLDTSDLLIHPEPPMSDPMSPKSRAWYEFDLAVVVALVSPVGNWLTGGDHIKNLLLVVFLILYLHQIIEVPWSLYKKSRPRRRAPQIPAKDAEERYKQLATSELRLLEMFFLALTTLSPFLGAVFLQYATKALVGPESVSWFSTSLFVLATGMRPWAHLIERLSQRTTDLHDVIHYPSPGLSVDDARRHMHDLAKRLEILEASLERTNTKISDAKEEVLEYVDDTVDAVEKHVRRNERKCAKYDVRVRDIEQVVVALQDVESDKRPPPRPYSVLSYVVPGGWGLTSFLPAWLPSSPPSSSLSPSSSYSSSASTRHYMHSPRSITSSVSVLEPIPEEDTKYPVLAKPSGLASVLLCRVGYVVTMPLRAVLRMITRTY